MQIADKYAPQEIEQKWYDYWERNEPVPGNFIDQGLDIRRDPVSTVTVFVFCNFFAVIFTTYNHHDLCNADVISGD